MKLKLLPNIKYNCLIPVHVAGVFCSTFVICSSDPVTLQINDTFEVHEVNTASGRVFDDKVETYTVVESVIGGVFLAYPQTENRLKLVFLPYDESKPGNTIPHANIRWSSILNEIYLSLRATDTHTTYTYN